jgi:hypothetical protein
MKKTGAATRTAAGKRVVGATSFEARHFERTQGFRPAVPGSQMERKETAKSDQM